jgi:Spy/CpxP family protein refolding chaperone
MKTTVIAAIVVVLAFVAGFISGAAVDHLVMHRRGPEIPRFAPRVIVNHLDRRLDLTADQRAKIEEILERHHQRMEGMWANVRPAMRTELEKTNDEIARVLTPEQREKFEKLKMRLGPRHGRRRGGPI